MFRILPAMGATRHDLADVVKCAKDAGRYALRVGRPIWTAGYDTRFCFDEASLRNRIRYVERHNVQAQRPARPWPFIVPIEEYLARIRGHAQLAPGH
jgi:hypothetical protein